jgi:phosphate transport system protein
MRNKFDEQLKHLNEELIQMGALVESAIASAVKAVVKHDLGIAKKAIAFDGEVDQKEKDIESICLKLLLHQQPVASDLRLISSALKMITDMERIGDQAADISELAILMSENPYVEQVTHIPQMAEATIKMVNESIDAFVKKDQELAFEVIAYDDVVDSLFDKVRNDLVQLIRSNKDNGGYAMDLLMVAKYFERIGDHATNIAEWVVFSITGEHKTFQNEE